MGKKKKLAKGGIEEAQIPDVDLDGIVDNVMKTTGGDVRAAILGMVRGQHECAPEVATRVSVGYAHRGPLK